MQNNSILAMFKSQTEYRMVLCNAIQIVVACLIASQNCFSSLSSDNVCAFNGARDIVGNYQLTLVVNIYMMYYLDFLIIHITKGSGSKGSATKQQFLSSVQSQPAPNGQVISSRSDIKE